MIILKLLARVSSAFREKWKCCCCGCENRSKSLKVTTELDQGNLTIPRSVTRIAVQVRRGQRSCLLATTHDWQGTRGGRVRFRRSPPFSSAYPEVSIRLQAIEHPTPMSPCLLSTTEAPRLSSSVPDPRRGGSAAFCFGVASNAAVTRWECAQ